MAKSSKLGPTVVSSNDVSNLIKQCVVEVKNAIQDEPQKFFPNGIELLEISVEVVTIKAALKIAGPKASGLLSGAVGEVVRTR